MKGDSLNGGSKRRKSRKRRDLVKLNYQSREQHFNTSFSVNEKRHVYEALRDPHSSFYFNTPSVQTHLKRYRKAVQEEETNQTEKKGLQELISSRIRKGNGENRFSGTLVDNNQLTDFERAMIEKRSSSGFHHKSKRSLSSSSSIEKTRQGFGIERRESKTFHSQIAASTTEYPKIGKNTEQEQAKKNNTTKDHLLMRTPRISSQLGRKKCQACNSPEETEKSGSRYSKQQLETKAIRRETAKQKIFLDKLAEQLHTKKHEKWMKFLEEKKQMLKKLKQGEENPQIRRKQ